MSLSVGIVGLPNVGKSTLFNALIKKHEALAANYPFATIEPNVGVVDVPDARLKILGDLVNTKKIVPALITFYDIAGLVKGAHDGEGLGNKFLDHIRKVDAILHVVRAFTDENVIRAGAVSPNDDIQTIEEIARKTIYLNFCDWMINEYFYLINSSGNTLSLKYIYSWIPSIEKFKFFETLKGEDGNNYNFSIVAHGEVKGEGYKKILFLVRFGDGSKNSVDTFLEEATQVKKKLIKSGDIGSAIYVSTQEFTSDSLKLFYEKTVEPRKGFGLSSLDRLTKYKGFVRIGFGRGFHLNLIEYNKKDHSFSVIAPLLK